MHKVLEVNWRGQIIYEDVMAPPRLRNEARVMLLTTLGALRDFINNDPSLQTLLGPIPGGLESMDDALERTDDARDCAEVNLLAALAAPETWMQKIAPHPWSADWLNRRTEEINGYLADPVSSWTDVISPITRDLYRVRPEMIWGIVSFIIRKRWYLDLNEELCHRFAEFRAYRPHPACWDYQVHLHLCREQRCRSVSYWSLDVTRYGRLLVVDVE